MEKKECLLSVKNLNIGFEDKKTQQKVVTDFNLTIGFGECVGLVGESGSGKSLSALAIAGLLKKRKNVIADGEIAFAGHSDFLSLEENELCKLRGTDIGMIFQEPMTSLRSGAHHRLAGGGEPSHPYRSVQRGTQGACHGSTA